MTPEQFKKLPKYVRQYITELSNDKLRLRVRLKSIATKKHSNSKICYHLGYGEDRVRVGLPPNAKIEMVDRDENIATISLENDDILVHSDGAINLKPRAHNYISIRMSKF